MPRIFISYRRDDSGYIAGMLAERLEDIFGAQSVFIDVDAIPLGVDFREYLNQAVAKSDLMLALIGDDWLTTKNAQGLRRLDDPADFVRIEIEAALKLKIPVVPVLLAQASMPLESELPPSLQSLAFRNAVEIRSGRDLNYHIEQLIRGLKTHYASLDSEPTEADTTQKPIVSINKDRQGAAPEEDKNKLKPLALFLGVLSVLAVLGLGLNMLMKSLSDKQDAEPNSLPSSKIEPVPDSLPMNKFPNPNDSNVDMVQQVPNLEISKVPPVEQVPIANQFDISSLTPSKGNLLPLPSLSVNYFQPCLAGTRNVIVGSGYDNRAEALARLKRFRTQYSNYRFKLLSTAASGNPYSNEQSAIVVGHGLDLNSALQLLTQVRAAGVATDAYITNQTVSSDCVDLSGFEK